MTMSGKIITVDASMTTLADVGVRTISVVVDSLNYPDSVLDATYTLKLDV